MIAPDIAAGVLRDVARAARLAFPEECCGVLIGRRAAGRLSIVAAIPSRNVATGNRRRRFEIDPGLLLALQRRLRQGPYLAAGYFHSHPRGITRPSRHDLAGAIQDRHVWLIAALAGPGHGVTFGAFATRGCGVNRRFVALQMQRIVGVTKPQSASSKGEEARRSALAGRGSRQRRGGGRRALAAC